jgi:hypothetical protein
MSKQWHCTYCGQTYVGSTTETCSLCNKSGGLVDPAGLSAKSDPGTVVQTKGIDPNTIRKFVIGCTIGVTVLIIGGGVWYYFETQRKAEAIRINYLKQIALAYFSYGDVNKKAPSKVEDIRPYLLTTTPGKYELDIYEAASTGQITVVWDLKGYRDAKEGSKLILAFETEAKQTSGFVIFADFRVVRLTREELEKAITEARTAP